MSTYKKNDSSGSAGSSKEITFEFENLDGTKSVETLRLDDGWLVAAQSSGSSSNSGSSGESGSGGDGGSDGDGGSSK